MRIGIVTWGSNGDARPFIALAAGLGRRGHDVHLHIASVESRDYRCFSTLDNVTLSQTDVPEPAKEYQLQLEEQVMTTANPVKQLNYIVTHFFDPVADELLRVSRELCADCDLVIGHVLVYPLDIAAREHKVPRISVSLAPLVPSGYIPPVGNISFGVFGNRLLWRLAQWLVLRFLRPRIQAMYRREGHEPPPDIAAEAMDSADLNLLAASPTVIPPPPDWPAHYRVPGFFNIREDSEPWSMPEDLRRFLEAGDKPVFIGFGSMMDVSVRFRDTTTMIVEAVKLAGCRAIIQSRWDELTDLPEHPDIYRIGSVPHKYLFPLCSLVVHHGGAGTTQSTLLAGCPHLVVSHGMDQDFWAGRLKALGVCIGNLPRRRLRADRLARLIRASLAQPELQQSANEVAQRIAREDGVAAAVELIEASFAGR